MYISFTPVPPLLSVLPWFPLLGASVSLPMASTCLPPFPFFLLLAFSFHLLPFSVDPYSICKAKKHVNRDESMPSTCPVPYCPASQLLAAAQPQKCQEKAPPNPHHPLPQHQVRKKAGDHHNQKCA